MIYNKPIKLIIVAIFILSCGAEARYISEHRLYLGTLEMEPGHIFTLKILPTGEIVDLYQQYTTTRWIADLCINPTKDFLFVGADTVIERFRINPSGDLTSLGTTYLTLKPHDISITPNNEYVIIRPSGLLYPLHMIYRLDTTGDLIDTYNRVTVGIWINPRGNPILVGGSSYAPGEAIWVSHLDYTTGTAFQTQVIPSVCNNPKRMVYSPDGSLGLLTGYLSGIIDVRSFKIDTTGTVSTTGAWNIGGTATDIEITPNARFALISIDTMIAIFAIDTTNGTISDTGKRWRPPLTNFLPIYLRITEDGKLVIIDYFDDSKDWITTAFIGEDGELTWTGYTFPFGETYVGGADAVTNMELLPVYVTGVDLENWHLYE